MRGSLIFKSAAAMQAQLPAALHDNTAVQKPVDAAVKDELEDSIPPEPLPSFNGALSKFAFAGSALPTTVASLSTTRITRGTTIVKKSTTFATASKNMYTSKKRLTPAGIASESPLLPPAPKKRRKRAPGGYVPPENYAHLSGISDALGLDMLCLFVGLNPGIATAISGHAYSAPSNLFWKLLHLSGLTPDRRLSATEDMTLPARYSLGSTNLVGRPTKSESELSKAEMDVSVGALEDKIRRWRPEAVCIVGKGIWESIWRVKKGRKLGKSDEFEFGWQEGGNMGVVEGEWDGARTFVTMSTSGLVAAYKPTEKERVWKILGEWVQERRRARGETAPKVKSESELPEEVLNVVKDEKLSTMVIKLEMGMETSAVVNNTTEDFV